MNRCYWGMNLEICKSFAVHPSEIALASVAKLSPVSVSDQFGKLQIKVSGDGFVQAHPDHIDCDTSNGDVMIELSPNASVTVRKTTADDHKVFIRTTGTVLTGQSK